MAPTGWGSFATAAGLLAVNRAAATLRKGKSEKSSAKKGGSTMSGGAEGNLDENIFDLLAEKESHFAVSISKMSNIDKNTQFAHYFNKINDEILKRQNLLKSTYSVNNTNKLNEEIKELNKYKKSFMKIFGVLPNNSNIISNLIENKDRESKLLLNDFNNFIETYLQYEIEKNVDKKSTLQRLTMSLFSKLILSIRTIKQSKRNENESKKINKLIKFLRDNFRDNQERSWVLGELPYNYKNLPDILFTPFNKT